MTEPIKMIEIFSGIGAQERAARQMPIPFDVVATMDVDKDAILSYASMRCDFAKECDNYEFPSKEQMVSELQAKNVGFDFQKNKHTITMKTNTDKVKQYYLADQLSHNLGDVSLQKELPYADIICHTSPCQDYSCAGKGAGGDEGSGTRSSLMFESLRLIETSKPKYVLWENVAAVLSGKHRHNFVKYLERMSELGYENAFDLLNGKNYGVPQNRLRIFCVSRKIDSDDNKIRNIDDMQTSSNKQVESTMKEIRNNPSIRMWVDYKFPETVPLTTRLKDMLEKNVDEKYYLPDERIEKILNSTFMQEKKRIQMTDVCDTLLARDWKDPKCVPVEEEPEVKQIMNIMPTKTRDNPNQGRVYDVNGIAPTLTKMDGGNREPFIVASRGRNPENPSDRTAGTPTEQRLEPNFSGCTNTLTSVQKDNYVCEPKIIQNPHGFNKGQIRENCPSITSSYFQENNYVCEHIVYDEPSRYVRKDGIVGTLTTDGSSPKYNNRIIEPVVEKIAIVEDQFPGSRDARIYPEYAPTLRQNCSGLKVADEDVENNIKWRIRKLTPKECVRLMNFTDKDHDAMAKYVCNSAIYKACGNSIVVACLIAIMCSLFIEDGYKAEVWTKYALHYDD